MQHEEEGTLQQTADEGTQLDMVKASAGFAPIETSDPTSPTSPSSPPATDEAPAVVYSPGHIVALTCPGLLMATLDQSVLDVSLVTIAADLDETLERTQWIVLIYYLVSASALSTFGRMGDRYDKVKTFQLGMVLFVCSSIACGFCQTLPALIGLRAVQALGGCAMTANGSSLTAAFTSKEHRGIAFGYNSVIVGIGLSLGPPIGGLITQYLGWRYLFWMNVPIGVVGFIFVWFKLPHTDPDSSVGMDPAGSVLVFAAAGTLM